MVDFEIEPSVHIRLYSMSKRHFAAIFLITQILFVALLIIGLKGPSVTEDSVYNVTKFNSSEYSLQKGPFVVKSPPVNSFNQQLWLHMIYSIEHLKGEKFEVALNVQVHWTGLETHMSEVSRGASGEHTKQLACSKGTCNEVLLAHLPYLRHPHYTFNVKTSGLEDLQFHINNIHFKFTTLKSQYTQLQIWFRFAFLILSFISTCSFAYCLRRFSVRNWSQEQRWLSLLLPLLILYNNPVFALSFLTSSSIPATVDIFVQSCLLAALLLFWLCIYHGLRQPQRKFFSFYLPKLLLVSSLWFSVCFLSLWQRFRDLTDPTIGGNYLNLKVAVLVLAVFFVIKLSYLLVRAFAEIRNMPYLDLRLKFMTSLLFGMVLVSIVSICIRKQQFFGVGFFPAMTAHPPSSLELALLYGLTNLHLFVLAYAFSPSQNAYYESHFKDNPALSMITESDEDVVYGEEISLTINKPVLQTKRYKKVEYDDDDDDDDAFN